MAGLARPEMAGFDVSTATSAGTSILRGSETPESGSFDRSRETVVVRHDRVEILAHRQSGGEVDRVE